MKTKKIDVVKIIKGVSRRVGMPCQKVKESKKIYRRSKNVVNVPENAVEKI